MDNQNSAQNPQLGQIDSPNTKHQNPLLTRSPNKKLNRKRLLIFSALSVLILLISLTALIILGYTNSNQGSSQNHIDSNIQDPNSANGDNEFYLIDNKVYRASDNKLIFVNVPSYIEKVVSGPDGNTIHFFRNDTGYSSCSHLSSINENSKLFDNSIEGNKDAIIERFAPWDYDPNKNDAALNHCGGARIYRSNSIAYIEIDNENTTLIVKKLSDNREKRIIFDDVIPRNELLDQYDKNGYYKSGNGLITGINKNYYYLDESIIVGNRFLLKYYDKIIGINLDTGEAEWFFDGLDSSKIVVNNYSLEREGDLPLVLLTSAWEGFGHRLGIIDLSNDEYNFVQLNMLDSLDYELIYKKKLETVIWQNDGIIFNNYKFTRLNEHIEEWEGLSEESLLYDSEPLNPKYEKKLISSGDYEGVVCDLGNIRRGGACYSIIKTSYKYTPNGIVEKVN